MNRGFTILIWLSLSLAGCVKHSGRSDLHITNGKPITEAEFPAVVAIEVVNPKARNTDLHCTGTFISQNMLLTAAHCAYGDFEPNGFSERKILVRINGEAPVKMFHYPKLSSYTPRRDIALFLFDKPIAQATLPISAKPAQVGQPFTIVGYGNYEGHNDATRGKKRVGHNLIKKIEDGLLVFEGLADGTDGSGKDASSAGGDSGGPMLVNNSIVGITTGGNGSTRLDSFYVDLHSPYSKEFFKLAREANINVPLPVGYLDDHEPSPSLPD